MAFANFTTLFSRNFLIGFLAAPLGGLFALSQLLTSDWLPEDYGSAGPSTKVVIVAAGAVLIALLLSGLQYPLVRLLEGYPFRGIRLISCWYDWRVRRWQQEFDQLSAQMAAQEADWRRTEAARRLNNCFPARRELVLPTELGNVLRSFETHPRLRYGLDGIAIWPRIVLLLSADERGQLEEAASSMQFFINSLVVTSIVGTLLTADAAVHAPSIGAALLRTVGVLLATAALAELFRRWSVDAGRRYGNPVRAAFDLHRLELYDLLGMRTPGTIAEDLLRGKAVNRMLVFSEPIADEHRKPQNDKEKE